MMNNPLAIFRQLREMYMRYLDSPLESDIQIFYARGASYLTKTDGYGANR